MLAFTSQTYSEAMAMRPSVTYTPCATSSREQTGDIITFTQFEEGNLLSETSNDAESGDKYDNKSVMPPLLIKEELGAMDYGDESDHDTISTEILDTFVMEVSLIRTLIGEKQVIKYVILLRKDNRNGKEC